MFGEKSTLRSVPAINTNFCVHAAAFADTFADDNASRASAILPAQSIVDAVVLQIPLAVSKRELPVELVCPCSHSGRMTRTSGAASLHRRCRS